MHHAIGPKLPLLLSAALCVGVGVALTGCGGATLQPMQRQAESAQWVRVEVTDVDRDILSFHVYNLSKLTLVVLRDKIVLETPQGRRGREPGGVRNHYNLPPASMHDVKVKFDLSDCSPGQEVKVSFENALVADGAPIRIAPIPFTCLEQ